MGVPPVALVESKAHNRANDSLKERLSPKRSAYPLDFLSNHSVRTMLATT